MKIIPNADAALHEGQGEFHQGRFVPCFENPSRLRNIEATLRQSSAFEFIEASDFGTDPIRRVHDADYLKFLESIWTRWQHAGNEGDVMPYLWPVPGLRRMPHENLNALVGSYAFSSDTPIMSGTWRAARQGAQAALSALQQVREGERSAFALTRPPGHHAHAAYFGGYCFLNNVAIVAQAAIDFGHAKVCILDVDFHHGNGTQDIFYDRQDVLTISLHGDPRTNFPYFLGYADETGMEDGEGANVNMPLPDGTSFETWSQALKQGLDIIAGHESELVIVALGVDTFEGDPISSFLLKTDDYLEMGRLIESLALPTVFVMEGGYDVGPIGLNVANVLSGFEG